MGDNFHNPNSRNLSSVTSLSDGSDEENEYLSAVEAPVTGTSNVSGVTGTTGEFASVRTSSSLRPSLSGSNGGGSSVMLDNSAVYRLFTVRRDVTYCGGKIGSSGLVCVRPSGAVLADRAALEVLVLGSGAVRAGDEPGIVGESAG